MLVCLGNTSFNFSGVQPYAVTGLGGIYSPHTPKEPLGKADKNSYRRLNDAPVLSTLDQPVSVFSLLLAVTVFQRLLDQSTDALEITIGLTGECKLRNPQKIESLDNCIDAQF